MSIIDKARCINTGIRSPLMPNLSSSLKNTTPFWSDISSADQYQIDLHLYINFCADKNSFDYAKKNAENMILRELYGDCEKYIYQIKSAIYGGHTHEAIDVLQQLQDEMYGIKN